MGTGFVKLIYKIVTTLYHCIRGYIFNLLDYVTLRKMIVKLEPKLYKIVTTLQA